MPIRFSSEQEAELFSVGSPAFDDSVSISPDARKHKAIFLPGLLYRYTV